MYIYYSESDYTTDTDTESELSDYEYYYETESDTESDTDSDLSDYEYGFGSIKQDDVRFLKNQMNILMNNMPTLGSETNDLMADMRHVYNNILLVPGYVNTEELNKIRVYLLRIYNKYKNRYTDKGLNIKRLKERIWAPTPTF